MRVKFPKLNQKFVYAISTILVICIVLMVINNLSIAKKTDKTTEEPFIREVAPALQKEIDVSMSEIRASYEISPKLYSEIWQNLELEDLGNRMPEVQDKFVTFFKNVGNKVVPILSEALIEEDPKIRRNAINALGLQAKPKEYQDEEYAQFEERVLIPLLIRSLNDRDVEVRTGAVATLGAMAFDQCYGFRRSVNARVIDALKEVMLNEQDTLALRIGITALVRIGRKDLIPERLKPLLTEVETEKF